jgi:hypothetical protein
MAALVSAPVRLHARSRQLRYRIAVLAPSVKDVVCSAGGWLFDRAWAGHQVTVLVADDVDYRPLRILGAEALDLDCALTPQVRTVWPDTLAVAADLYRHDERVRQGVLETISGGMTNIVMWGDNWPAELETLTTSVQHPLSVAARAFKARALRVTVHSQHVGPVETFRGFDLRTLRKGSADLLTAS